MHQRLGKSHIVDTEVAGSLYETARSYY
jgi:hypothetical protein